MSPHHSSVQEGVSVFTFPEYTHILCVVHLMSIIVFIPKVITLLNLIA